MWAVGRDLANELTNSSLSRQELDRDLYSLGLRDGDVITLRTAGVERHYEIGGKDEKERL
jgi:aminoglycoside N3'-acetyltransferase